MCNEVVDHVLVTRNGLVAGRADGAAGSRVADGWASRVPGRGEAIANSCRRGRPREDAKEARVNYTVAQEIRSEKGSNNGRHLRSANCDTAKD